MSRVLSFVPLVLFYGAIATARGWVLLLMPYVLLASCVTLSIVFLVKLWRTCHHIEEPESWLKISLLGVATFSFTFLAGVMGKDLFL